MKKDKNDIDNTTEEVRKILRGKSPKDLTLTDHLKRDASSEREIGSDAVYQNLQTPEKLKKAILQPELGERRHKLVFDYKNNLDKVIPIDIEKDKIIAVTVFPARRGRYI